MHCGRIPSAQHIKTHSHTWQKCPLNFWILGGQDEANESTAGWRSDRRTRRENWYFLTHSSLVSPVPIPEINLLTVWNKPFRVYSLVCHGWRAKVDNGNRWAKHSTIMPVTGTDWLDLESLWFGFEEQWHFLLCAEFFSSRLRDGLHLSPSLFILGQSHLLA